MSTILNEETAQSTATPSYAEAAIERLSVERKARGLSVSELAKRANMSERTVRRTLHGDRNHRYNTEDQGRLCDAMGINPFELVDDAAHAKADANYAAAQAVSCGFDDCDLIGHDPYDSASNWTHRVEHFEFDGGVIKAEIQYRDADGYRVYMEMDANCLMTAEQLRGDVELYAGYPEWIRAISERLDALNTQAVAS